MITIGVDPHKRSHTAIAIDENETVYGQITLTVTDRQVDQLLAFAARHPERRWAIEGAAGMGALLARQLVAAGETVLDVPPTLSARVRLLDRGRTAKTDAHDARAAAIVALRHNNLRSVNAEDHAAVLRLLAGRRYDLVAQRTRVVCRLHALVAQLQEGGTTTGLTAQKAAEILANLRPVTGADIERHRLCGDLLGELSRLDTSLNALRTRTAAAVEASGTTVTAIHASVPSPPPSSSATPAISPGSRPAATGPGSTAPHPSTPRPDR